MEKKEWKVKMGEDRMACMGGYWGKYTRKVAIIVELVIQKMKTTVDFIVCFGRTILNHRIYTQNDPRFLFEKSRGQPQELWPLARQ